jgi:hypothetical protein
VLLRIGCVRWVWQEIPDLSGIRAGLSGFQLQRDEFTEFRSGDNREGEQPQADELTWERNDIRGAAHDRAAIQACSSRAVSAASANGSKSSGHDSQSEAVTCHVPRWN